jgi:hypothetical protein
MGASPSWPTTASCFYELFHIPEPFIARADEVIE